MNMTHLFRAAALCASAVLLAACGGGGGSTTTAATATPTPYASAAMFVPASASGISIPLSCTGADESSSATSATLAINADGDLTFSGAPGESTSVVEIAKIKYAEATYRYFDVELEEGAVTAYIQYDKETKGESSYIRIDSGDTGDYAFYASTGSTYYHCALTNGTASFSLQRELTEARLAATMLKGVTAISADDADFTTLMNGVAYWESDFSDDAAVRYFALNLSTGVLTGNPTPSVPHDKPTNLRLALPSLAATNYAYYYEEDDKGEKKFYLFVEPKDGYDTCVQFKVLGSFIEPEGYCD